MIPFFSRVYRLVRMIPYGQVATYGQIADILEHPRGARMVGWALHGLHEGTDVPWHRVINSRGCVSTAPPTDPYGEQRRLLEAEGVLFDANGRVDLHRFGWSEDEFLHQI